MKCLAFGEVLWDVIDGEEHLGGAPLNLLAHMAIMGADSEIISAIGDDDRGRKIIEELSRIHVSDILLQKVDYPTGWVDVELSGGGQPTYTIHENVAFDNVEMTTELESSLKNNAYDVFCFGTLAQRGELSQKTLKEILEKVETKEIFYDVNLRQKYFSKEMVEESLKSATIVKLNDAEVEVLSELLFDEKMQEDVFAEKLKSVFNVGVIIVTKGKKGCSVYSAKDEVHVEGVKVEPADTVGAGDAFSAGFLYTYISTGDIHQSAEFANKVGAYVTTQHGAIPEDTSYISNI